MQDIIDSKMGNMGWPDAESYGLTWKVRGLCTDLSNVEIMDDHNVYGDIMGSEIYGAAWGDIVPCNECFLLLVRVSRFSSRFDCDCDVFTRSS